MCFAVFVHCSSSWRFVIRIAVLNQKGGVGKTTLAIHISDALARREKRVMLVDADPQGTALDWAAARVETSEATGEEILFPVIGLPTKALQSELPGIAGDYDCVVIDGPPHVDTIAASAIMASDFVLIPVLPSPYDVWACDDINELVEQVTTIKSELQAVFVINRKIAGTVIGKEVRDALEDYPLSLLKTEIYQRVAFADSATKGRTVLQTAPKGVAAKEINNLVNEIMERFDGQGRLILGQAT